MLLWHVNEWHGQSRIFPKHKISIQYKATCEIFSSFGAFMITVVAEEVECAFSTRARPSRPIQGTRRPSECRREWKNNINGLFRPTSCTSWSGRVNKPQVFPEGRAVATFQSLRRGMDRQEIGIYNTLEPTRSSLGSGPITDRGSKLVDTE